MTAKKLMFEEGNQYLSLAVPVKPRLEEARRLWACEGENLRSWEVKKKRTLVGWKMIGLRQRKRIRAVAWAQRVMQSFLLQYTFAIEENMSKEF
jgi:hypothetical protein